MGKIDSLRENDTRHIDTKLVFVYSDTLPVRLARKFPCKNRRMREWNASGSTFYEFYRMRSFA